MHTRPIPATGEALPVIGLGTYQVLDVDDTAAATAPLEPVVRAFVDGGGAMIDSSPMYGNAETITGTLTERLSLRRQVFLATKVWTSGREAGIRQMDQSFARMRTERMDLMQVHNLQDWATHQKTLQAWKAEGRVRYVGITHYHSGAYGELARLMKTRQWDFVQFNYSLGEREAEGTILPLAKDLGIAVIANRPFAQGALFSRTKGRDLPPWAADIDCSNWATFFLKWIVSHPAVTCAIPASRKVDHMQQNVAAGHGRLPDAAMRERMARYFDTL
jgi:diketogulonate reductase-like aldo/keto reductase